MSRINFKRVQASGNGENGGGFKQAIEKFTFDSTNAAQKIKLMIPSIDGQPLLYELPYHELNPKAEHTALTMPKKDGGQYTPYEFACISHVVQRPGELKDKLKKLKEEQNETCPLCDIYYAETRKFYEMLRTEHPDFSSYSNEDKRKIYQDFDEKQRTVLPSYEVKKQEDGYNQFIIHAKRRLVVAVLDDNTSNYTLKYMDVSLKRLEMIQSAIAQAVDAGIYPEERVESFRNADGENELNITDIELLFTFPKGKKVEAGRNLTIGVIAPAKSRTANDDVLIEKVRQEVTEKLDAIDKQIENDYYLKYRPLKDVKEFINQEYYDELMEKYPPKEFVPDEEKSNDEKKSSKTSKKAKKEDTDEVVESVEDLFAE